MTLVLNSVTVMGSTVYDEAALEDLYAELLGTTVSLETVFGIAEAVTRRYRKDGYVLSQAILPAGQQLDPGGADITIEVTEGFVDQIKFQDNEYATGERRHRIRDLLSKIPQACHAPVTKGEEPCPLHRSVLERYILLANDLPGVDTNVTVLRGDRHGAVNLFVTVTETAFDAYANYNNRGSKYIGPAQLQLGARTNSLFGGDSSTELSALFAEDTDELRLGRLNQEFSLGSEGLTLRLAATYSESEPGHTLRDLEIESDNTDITGSLVYPLVRSRSSNLFLNGEFTYREQETDSLGEFLSEDKLSVLRLGITYDRTDALMGGGITLYDLRLHQGLDILDATESGSSESGRPIGDSEASKLTGQLSRLQQLGGSTSLLVELSGQYAFDTLLVSEMFAFGGEYVGRAYDPSEIIGDHGLALKTELRYFPGFSASYLQASQLYLYYDIGRTWLRDRPCACDKQERNKDAAALGFGARFNVTSAVSGYLEVSEPLNRKVSAEGNKDTRLFFNISFIF